MEMIVLAAGMVAAFVAGAWVRMPFLWGRKPREGKWGGGTRDEWDGGTAESVDFSEKEEAARDKKAAQIGNLLAYTAKNAEDAENEWEK
ncbi:MAG: hypothetical protein VB082_08115 [Christensenella sp.]|nr:hypothetical protein [Christensenella sp.]